MSIFNASQVDYPAYEVDIELEDTRTLGSGGSLKFWVIGVQPAADQAVPFSDLLTGIKAWAESYSWPPSGSDSVVFQSMTATEYSETTSDVSP